jgi:PleD family two-component response regulator
VADVPSGSDTAMSVIERADVRLYEAKHAGRNRVISA